MGITRIIIKLKMNEEKPIRILTLNMYLRGPCTYKHFCTGDYKNERIDDFRQHLKNYDIICFQEVFGVLCFRREKLIKVCKEEGLIYSNYPPTKSCILALLSSGCPVIDGGLLIVSRYPIVDYDSEQFSLSP